MEENQAASNVQVAGLNLLPKLIQIYVTALLTCDAPVRSPGAQAPVIATLPVRRPHCCPTRYLVLLERKREVPYYLMLAVEQQDRELARAEMETDGFIGRAPDRDVAIVAGEQMSDREGRRTLFLAAGER